MESTEIWIHARRRLGWAREVAEIQQVVFSGGRQGSVAEVLAAGTLARQCPELGFPPRWKPSMCARDAQHNTRFSSNCASYDVRE